MPAFNINLSDNNYDALSHGAAAAGKTVETYAKDIIKDNLEALKLSRKQGDIDLFTQVYDKLTPPDRVTIRGMLLAAQANPTP
jgi:hypothetical protein